MNADLEGNVSRYYRAAGQVVREIREHRGLSQEELARRLDLDPSHVSRWESGNRQILLHRFVDLARELRIEPRGLLVRVENRHRLLESTDEDPEPRGRAVL